MKVHLALFSYGGISGHAFDCVLDELSRFTGEDEALFSRPIDDALISRSRSKVASQFLEGTCDVLFMLDHDIGFAPGDLIATCRKALDTGAMVGGLYALKTFGAGFSSRCAEKRGALVIGVDALVKATYLASGFMAAPRAALDTMLDKLSVASIDALLSHLRITKCVHAPGEEFYDFFRPVVAESTLTEGRSEYLSEDWAFSRKASACGIQPYVYLKPRLKHHGDFGFSVEDGGKR